MTVDKTDESDETNAPGMRDVVFNEALSERYLAYALSTIMSRSLPDVRDGLKPVQRRLLYAMRQLRLDPNGPTKKSARVVGDVMGKFHPHGDASIYDALVRLAQAFSLRYPLIDGHGNFGNIDGDNPAAMRYTEARMTLFAELMLQGIDLDTVDFRENYDGEDQEPVVLPANFPNLLANGSQGIAVGMATSIPPHNASELLEGLLHLIDAPKTSVAELLAFIPGPDFPTGGTLVEDGSTIAAGYSSGKGSFRVRAKWEVEKLKGGTYQIVVTEIPFQVQKSRLMERLGELVTAKKLPMLSDVLDESAEDIRLVLEPRARNVQPELLMEQLFKHTELESRFSLNLNVLDKNNAPKVMDLKQILQAFLDHRKEVLLRRSQNRLDKIDKRLHLLDGFLVVYLNLDEVIQIIRFDDHPKQKLMETFELSEAQAEAVLNLRLRALHKLQELELKGEHKDLTDEKAQLTLLMGSDRRQWTAIKGELKTLREMLAEKTPDLLKRRTVIAEAPKELEVPVEALIDKEPITVILSKIGWIRAVKGHAVAPADIKFKAGDAPMFFVRGYTTDRFVVMSQSGRAFTLSGDKLPSGRGFGEPISLIVDWQGSQLIDLWAYNEKGRRLFAADDGRGFVCKEEDLLSNQRGGKQAVNLGAGAVLIVTREVVAGDDHVAVTGTSKKMLIFPLEDLPELARGRGNVLMKFSKGKLTDAKTFCLEDGLTWRWGADKTRTFSDLSGYVAQRAQAGKAVPAGFPKDFRFD